MAYKTIRSGLSVRPSKYGIRSKTRIPQPENRDVQLRKRDVVRWEEINIEYGWFTLHKRGPRRPKEGQDPLEARAVPHGYIRGTLPERIVYYYLTNYMKFMSGVDFTFQSSQMGGRLELGGIVVDFLFPMMKIIIQVQGPTHDGFRRSMKDKEQNGDLERMGYKVYELDDTVIYDEYLLEEWMRRTFAMPNGVGGGGGAYGSHESEVATFTERELYNPLWDGIYNVAVDIYTRLDRMTG